MPAVFHVLIYFWIFLSCAVFFILLKIPAPYGRHIRSNWGPAINNTAGWIIMELVSPGVFALFFLSGENQGIINWIFFSFWMAHYLHRSIIFPLRLPDKRKKMPLIIMISAVFFNSANGFFNGYYLGVLQRQYDLQWFYDPRFIPGVVLFFTGAFINISSDNRLIRLRKSSSPGEYKIPRGGLFRWISSPNYFGEILEWFGWALATWSLPGLSFAIWTAANLLPRALEHHRWYHRHFPDYPNERKAIIPWLV